MIFLRLSFPFLRYFFFLSVGVTVALSPAHAQKWYHYSKFFSVACIDTSLGDYWIGTSSAGIYHYDGISWTGYSESDGLPDNIISRIILDEAGRVWAATQNGIGRYDGIRWTAFTDQNAPIFSGGVSDIAVQDTNVWISSRVFGVAHYNGTQWKRYDPSNSGMASGMVTRLARDGQGRLWCLHDKQVSVFDGSAWTVHDVSDASAIATRLSDMAADKNGQVWITSDKGLWTFENNAWQRKSTAAYNANGYLAIDGHNNKWCSVTGDRILRYGNGGWTAFTIPNFGSDNSIFGISAGKNGHVSVGTYRDHFVLQNGTWQTLNAWESPGLYVHRVVEAPNNHKWCCVENGVAIFDGQDWQPHNLNPGIVNYIATGAAFDHEGAAWMTVLRGGAVKYENNTWARYGVNDGMASNMTYDVAVAADSAVWFATRNGISRLKAGQWQTFHPRNTPLPDSMFYTMTIDSSGTLWFGSFKNGVVSFDGNAWKTYNTLNSDLSNDRIWSLETDPRGNVWAGTENGLNKFDGTDWTAYYVQDGLPGNLINDIAFERDAKMWVATNRGAGYFDGQKWQTLNYLNSELQANFVNSVTVDAAGDKWFGFLEGVSRLGGSPGSITTAVPRIPVLPTLTLTVSPHPVADEVHLLYALPEEDVTEVALYTMHGRPLLRRSAVRQAAGTHNETFSVREIPSGMYVVCVQGEKIGKSATRLIIAR